VQTCTEAGRRLNAASAMTEVPAPARRDSRVARAVIAALALAVTAAAVAHRVAWNRAHDDALGLADATGLSVRRPAVVSDAVWDPDPMRARLAVARGLLAEAYDAGAFAQLPVRAAADAASRLNEHLDLARRIAADAFAELPCAWQAAMIVGSATNRVWMLAGDARVFAERAAWETPLRVAAELAPGEDEPLRPLVVAWLETWPLLPESVHVEARAAVRRAFADPDTFKQCAALWLVAVPERDEAFALVPDLPWAWSVVEESYRARAYWDGFCAARARRELAALQQAELGVRDAAEHNRGGDAAGARALALSVVEAVPADRRFAGVLTAALVQCPPGAVSTSPEASLRWLGPALEGFVRGRMWLPAEVVARLAASAGEFLPPTAAVVALAGGDLAGAEVIERRAEAGSTEVWTPYWIAKARILAATRRVTEARAALARVNRSWSASVPVLTASVAVAEAGGDATAVAAARAQLDGVAAASWRATDWRWHGLTARLDLCAMRAAQGFEIALSDVPPHGTVVQVSLDGAPVAMAPARADEALLVSTPVSAGAHLVELTTVTGGRVVPGDLALRASAAPGQD
jgi:hypothetical protein